MLSERLRYHPVEPANLDAFHRLVQDEHVRRYMMDGNAFSPEWSAERIRESQGFERTAVLQGAFGNLLLLRLSAGR